MTFSNISRISLKKHAALYDIALVLGGVIFTSLCAQIAIRLPFSPVPVTMQTLAVTLTAALLGRQLGTISMISYLLAGSLGLPVFASGAGGFAYLAGPTGGYLFGFIGAAWLIGLLVEKGWDRNFFTVLAGLTLGLCVIFTSGLAWLSVYVGSENVFTMGLMPFIPGAVYKLITASILIPVGKKYLFKQKIDKK